MSFPENWSVSVNKCFSISTSASLFNGLVLWELNKSLTDREFLGKEMCEQTNLE